jgi:mono/diheme cytochrome c family protein
VDAPPEKTGLALPIAIVVAVIALGIGIPALLTPTKERVAKDAAPPTGAELFRLYNCIVCHGEDGSGPRADLRPIARKGDTEKIAATIRDPSAMKKDAQMPNLRIPEDEIAALASYVVELARGSR